MSADLPTMIPSSLGPGIACPTGEAQDYFIVFEHSKAKSLTRLQAVNTSCTSRQGAMPHVTCCAMLAFPDSESMVVAFCCAEVSRPAAWRV